MPRWLGYSAIATAFVLGITAGAIRESGSLPFPKQPNLEARESLPVNAPAVAEAPTGDPLPEEIVRAGEGANGANAIVTYVVDGDTLEVRFGDTLERVRILGIDTPERGDCGFDSASARLYELVGKQEVLLIPDPTQRDHDGYKRLLRYVEFDGMDVGRQMVLEGEALVDLRYPTTRTEEYLGVQEIASTQQQGSWSFCGWQ